MSGTPKGRLRWPGPLIVLGLMAHLMADGLAAGLPLDPPPARSLPCFACATPGQLTAGEPHGDSLTPSLAWPRQPLAAELSVGTACLVAWAGHPPPPLHPPQLPPNT